MTDNNLQALLDKQEITELLHNYCRALDRGDARLLVSLFHPESVHEMAGFKGSSIDFCGFAMDAINVFEFTHHLLGNVLIALDGDSATSECYFHAFHRIAADTVAEGGVLPDHTPGIDEDLLLGGRYIDRLVRHQGQWKFIQRAGVMDWCRWEPVAEKNFFGLGVTPYGSRGSSDPSALL